MPAAKLGLGVWIMLPQSHGEFHLYHGILNYLLIVEKKVLTLRCEYSSKVVGFIFNLAIGSLRFMVNYLTEECVLEVNEKTEEMFAIIQEEVETRSQNA